jgi:hypothetical protein
MFEQFLVSAGLVLLGFGLGRLPPWLDRKRRLESHWQALRGELLLCTERVNIFLEVNVKAPLYRLPTRAFDAALKALLGEGAKRLAAEIDLRGRQLPSGGNVPY